MEIDLVLVPYDSARRGERMGAGPAHLAARLAPRLEQRGHVVRRVPVEPPAESWRAEIGTAFELAKEIAEAVRAARHAGRLPVVMAGNCAASWGACAGLGAGAGVVWADAHGDFNTPESTIGGFLDGMALATLTGRCWTAIARRIPGFAAVPEHRVFLVGARDFDPMEDAALERSAVHRVPADAVGQGAAEAIARALGTDAPVYLHLDLDVLDPASGRANHYAVPNGVPAAALAAFCGEAGRHLRPAAITLSAYEPACDGDGRAAEAAVAAIDALLTAMEDPR